MFIRVFTLVVMTTCCGITGVYALLMITQKHDYIPLIIWVVLWCFGSYMIFCIERNLRITKENLEAATSNLKAAQKEMDDITNYFNTSGNSKNYFNTSGNSYF